MCLVAPESDSEALDGDSPCPGASHFAQVSVDSGVGSRGPPAVSWPRARWSRGLSASPPLPAPRRLASIRGRSGSWLSRL